MTAYKFLSADEKAAAGGRLTREKDERITHHTLAEFYMRHRDDRELNGLDFLMLMGPARFAQVQRRVGTADGMSRGG